jgi:hypothetical protein
LYWRRLTLFETAVAVPAIAAVLAIPRSRPGTFCSSQSSRGFGGVEGGDEI